MPLEGVVEARVVLEAAALGDVLDGELGSRLEQLLGAQHLMIEDVGRRGIAREGYELAVQLAGAHAELLGQRVDLDVPLIAEGVLDEVVGPIEEALLSLGELYRWGLAVARSLGESLAQAAVPLQLALDQCTQLIAVEGLGQIGIRPDLTELQKLVTKAAELQEEVKQGKSSAALAVAAILKQLEEIKAKIGGTPTPPTPPAQEAEYVDLGLSVKWASCNLGANSPEQPGDYYAWGETAPKEDYGTDTYKYLKAVTLEGGSREHRLTKYCTVPADGLDGFTDGKTQLEPADDAATVRLGAPWRMSTEAEVEELVEGCTWSKETINGIPCLRATSKANGKSIVVCVSGFMSGTTNDTRGSMTAFWASTLSSSEGDRGVAFLELGKETFSPEVGYAFRFLGLPIRPVRP